MVGAGAVLHREEHPYAAGVGWIKVKNPDYTQKEGRAELFHPR